MQVIDEPDGMQAKHRRGKECFAQCVHTGSLFKGNLLLALGCRPEGGARDTRHAACGYLCAVGRPIVKNLRAKSSGVTYHSTISREATVVPLKSMRAMIFQISGQSKADSYSQN